MMGQQSIDGADDERLLRVQDVADFLQVDAESVRRWLRSGKLTGINLDRAGWRIRRTDLDRFLAARTGRPDSLRPGR